MQGSCISWRTQVMIPQVLNLLLDVGEITEVQPFKGCLIGCDQTIFLDSEVL